MSDSNEQTIVINDMLSFISCKMKLHPRDKLIKCLKEFYPEKAAVEAEKTLVASLPEIEPQARKQKEKDPFVKLCNSFSMIPEDNMPVFVCKNLNNVPKMDVDNELQDDDDSEELINEQKFIKAQIAEISSVVYQLKDQIQLLAAQRSKSKAADDMKKRSKGSSSRQKEILAKKSVPSTGSPQKKGLAYLQTLIDQEEEEKSKRLSVKKKEPNEENFSDLEGDDDIDDNVEDEDDENILQLIANRRQRALVKNAEAEILNGKRVSSPLKRIISNSGTSKRKAEFTENAGKNSKQKLSHKRVILSGDDDDDVDPDYEEELHDDDEDNESDNDDQSEGKSSKDFERQDKSHIKVEQVHDENIGDFSIYKCSLCNFSTNDEAAIERHDCPQVRIATCCFCDVTCNNADSFNDHLKIHSKVKRRQTYECLLCLFSCDERLILVEHMKTHSWVKPFKCHLCKFSCSDESRFKNHMIYHKEEDTPDFYNCHVCGKYFGSRTNLDKHKSRHLQKFEFVCNYCHISFNKKSGLNHHIFIYSKERSIICLKCFRLFINRPALKIHEKSCTENKKESLTDTH